MTNLNVKVLSNIQITKLDETVIKKWYEYWLRNGFEIVILSWTKLEKYYNKKQKLVNLQFGNESIFSRERIKLWRKNYKKQYVKCFYDWTQKYYESSMKLIDESSKIEIIKIDESKELIKLGLPLNFGSNKINKCRANVRKHNLYKMQNNDYDVNLATEVNNIEENQQDKIIMNKRKFENINKNTKKKMKKVKNVPSYIVNDKSLVKYWLKRHLFFSKFEEGIQLDKESWFSVTPERIAIHIAEKFKNLDIIIDAFCGCGGNTIQFAKKCKKVIAIDIDPVKISMARNNAKIYKVENKIEFVIGDFLTLSENLVADGVFLSPPWGGPSYKDKSVFNLENDLQPTTASNLFKKVRTISSNIAIFLPKNADKSQIISLAGNLNKVQIEHNYFDQKVMALTAFYGDQLIT